MEIDRRYLMCMIELRAVRSLLGELIGPDLVERNNEFDRSIVRRLIELRAVLSLLGNCKVSE